MKIFDSICSFERPTAVAIGSFDGLHLGHRAVIQACLERSQSQGLDSVVFTFQNHPKTVVNPNDVPPLLTTPPEKERLLADMGVKNALIVPFNQTLSQMAPEAFIQDILISKLKAKFVSVGYNFHFGHQAKGTPELLKAHASDFETHVQAAKMSADTVVSSTKIRSMLADGAFSDALPLLQGQFLMTGQVVSGQGIATTVLGVPTANLALPKEKLIPKFGVYACDVYLNGNTYQGIVNIGKRPTFNGLTVSVECYIFDFSNTIYGEEVTLSLKTYLRPEQRFSSPDGLKEQIQKDIALAQQILN